ncbi:hypothetical protein C8R46DRAFT_1286225 [Mycena filopes]|nr:hypothetical protein C8R46DRAFT_1286225 [Mycena filopes]
MGGRGKTVTPAQILKLRLIRRLPLASVLELCSPHDLASEIQARLFPTRRDFKLQAPSLDDDLDTLVPLPVAEKAGGGKILKTSFKVGGLDAAPGRRRLERHYHHGCANALSWVQDEGHLGVTPDGINLIPIHATAHTLPRIDTTSSFPASSTLHSHSRSTHNTYLLHRTSAPIPPQLSALNTPWQGIVVKWARGAGAARVHALPSESRGEAEGATAGFTTHILDAREFFHTSPSPASLISPHPLLVTAQR